MVEEGRLMQIEKLYDYVVVLYRGKEHLAGDGISVSFRRGSDGRLKECPMDEVPVGLLKNPKALVVK